MAEAKLGRQSWQRTPFRRQTVRVPGCNSNRMNYPNREGFSFSFIQSVVHQNTDIHHDGLLDCRGLMSTESVIPIKGSPMSPSGEIDDRQQIQQQTVKHDKRAPDSSKGNPLLEKLYRQYADELRRYLSRILGSGPPDPDDICQEAFRRLAEAKNLDEIKNPNAFLWRTAQNAIVSEQRKGAVRIKHTLNVERIFYPDRGDGFSPERVLLARAELSTILDVLENMDEKRREVLVMARFDGLSLAEIARRLGVARPTVSKRLAQAMLELDAAVEKPKD